MDRNEQVRLAALYEFSILDTRPEAEFDDLVALAARVCAVPIALIGLADAERLWFKARLGVDVEQVQRKGSICSTVMEAKGPFLVTDASRDERFADSPLVTGAPGIRFYGGHPLVTSNGHVLGTLCVIDREPRTLDDEQVRLLSVLAHQATALIERRRATRAVGELLAEQITLREALLAERSQLERSVDRRTRDLQAAVRELEQFSYTVAHDLRAPLRAIHGHAAMLRERLPAPQQPQVYSALSRIEVNAVRMGNLIDDLLVFSRLARVPLNQSTFAPRVLIDTVVDGLAPLRAGRDVRIDVEVPDTCQGDRGLIEVVFANLLENALKFSEKRPQAQIVVRGQCGEHETVFEVRDNGIGFDMAHRDKLFALFERLDLNAGSHSTGAGLALVKRIVERHGGRVWAEGKIDCGASIFFSLPQS